MEVTIGGRGTIVKKLRKCPICGSLGEDMAFSFFCSNLECQNFREDIMPRPSSYNNEDEESDQVSIYWPVYNDDD